MLRSAWLIGVKDLQLMLRQRETLLWTFLMPPIFFYFIGTVTGGGKLTGSRHADPLAVTVPADGGFLVDELERRLDEQDFAVVRFDPDGVELREPDAAPGPEAVLGSEGEPAPPPRSPGDFARSLVVPERYTERALAGEPVTLTARRTGDGLATDVDELRIRLAVYTVLADLVAAVSERPGGAPGEVGPEDFARLRAMPRELQLSVAPAGRRREIPRGFEQTVPGTMVMFTLLVLLTTGASSLIIERRQGLLRRLASAPITRGSIVLGKWGGKLALAIVQIAFAMLLGRYGFGVHWGPGRPMVALVMLAYASLLSSLGILLASFARSEGQAIGLGVLTANVFAALGGCWWPIEVTPPFMQKLALFLPTGWAMDALHALVSFGADASTVLPHVLGMFAGALVLGKVAGRVFRFE